MNKQSFKMAKKIQEFDSRHRRVILNIISAYGFSLVKGSLVVHATLMNTKLQTPVIPVNSNEIKFSNEIIWTMENSELKNLKMSNASIRVECYHLPNNERLGYILLKVKEAQTINPQSNDCVKSQSYKLIGTKNCSYNLKMSLRIEEFKVKTFETSPKKVKNSTVDNFMNNCVNLNENDQLQKIGNANNLLEQNTNFEERNDLGLSKTFNNPIEQTENLFEKNEVKNNMFIFNVQQKLIEELEDWKEKQMILFNEKMKLKEEQLLKEFNNKWLHDKKHIEDELTREVSKCKTLAENMDKMADMLNEREAIVKAKELELTCRNDSLDNKYIGLVQNLQSSNVQTVQELNIKLSELKTKLHDFEKCNLLLKMENEQLKDDINNNCGLQIQKLEQKILNLESKYEEANKSSIFFKERWITSVRKINKMYTQLGSKDCENLLNNRQNIQNILTKQSIERQHDEEKLKKLLNDLGKLRQDMANPNDLDP